MDVHRINAGILNLTYTEVEMHFMQLQTTLVVGKIVTS